MKNNILKFSNALLLCLGCFVTAIAQDTEAESGFYVYGEMNYECRIPMVMALPLPDEANDAKEEIDQVPLVKNLHLIKLDVISGQLPVDFEDMLSGKIELLAAKLDYSYTLPFTKIEVVLSIDDYGKSQRVFVDGDRLDEHLVKALEDELLDWQIINSKLEGELKIRFSCSLHSVSLRS